MRSPDADFNLGAMTYRTYAELECACGHKGSLKTAENDAPFSTEWFRRTVEGFEDNDTGFGIAKLKCPNCGEVGLVKRVRTEG